MDLPEVKENDMDPINMDPMKMSWHTEGGLLTSSWAESEARESYHPAWMESSYPEEANATRSPGQSSPSPFGKPW
jgi:hypothetical protein